MSPSPSASDNPVPLLPILFSHLVLSTLLSALLLLSLLFSPVTFLLSLLHTAGPVPYYDLASWESAWQTHDKPVPLVGLPVMKKAIGSSETERGLERERGSARSFGPGARRIKTMPDYYVDYR